MIVVIGIARLLDHRDGDLEIAQGDTDAAIAFYEDWFASEGMEIVLTMSGEFASVVATSDTGVAQVTVVEGPPVELLLAWSPSG